MSHHSPHAASAGSAAAAGMALATHSLLSCGTQHPVVFYLQNRGVNLVSVQFLHYKEHLEVQDEPVE